MRQKINIFTKKIKTAANINNGVLLIAIIVAIGFVWSTVSAIQKNFSLQQKVDLLTQEVAVNELENQTLQLQRAYYASDQYLELSARERLNLANPGERLLILPANTVATVESAVANTDAMQARSNFEQWIYFLFGKK